MTWFIYGLSFLGNFMSHDNDDVADKWLWGERYKLAVSTAK